MTLLKKLARSIRTRSAASDEKIRWKRWLGADSVRRANEREAAPDAIDAFARKPLVSVILPVYNIEEPYLRKCLESVRGQWYPNWELCIADDGSLDAHVRRVLEEFARKDERVKLTFRESNGGISAASNSALGLAAGEFCALLDHDDELAEDALFHVVAEINRYPNADLIYSDEDKIDGSGTRFDPAFKPDWSRDLFYSLNLLNHLTVYRTEVARAAGAFRSGFEGSQDYDLALRVIEGIAGRNIRHIPRILYHWRALPGSVALAGGEKSYAHGRARSALAEHFERLGINAEVKPAANDWHRVRYRFDRPDVTADVIVYGTEAQEVERSALTLERTTEAPNARFRQVVCHSAELSGALNDAGRGSAGEVICFVAAGLTPLSADWLEELMSFALADPIGAAGAKILNPDETAAGTGLVISAGGSASPAHFGLPRGLGGNVGRNLVVSNYSAVSIMCMATRRELFAGAGAFDSAKFPSSLFDVDYCLRLREGGYRIVVTPYAELIGSKGSPQAAYPGEDERKHLRTKWPEHAGTDPFYNPNFSNADGRFRIGELNTPADRE